MEKYKHMEQEQEWWTLADAIERGEQRNNALLQEEFQVGKQQGIKEGKQQGIKEGKQQGIKEGKQQGIKEGKIRTQQKILKSQIELKFKVDASDWIHTLDSETMDKATLLLLNCDSFDDLKQRMD